MLHLGSWFSRLARHRLTHFAVGGAVLFALSSTPADPDELALDGARLERLVDDQARRDGVAVDAALRAEVLAQVVDDELLVREARRLGLDLDDAILRRRLMQKAMFVAEDLGGASRPLQASELQEAFEERRERYRVPARVAIRQIYSSDASELARLLPSLAGGAEPLAADGLPLWRRLEASDAELERELGPELVAELGKAPLGRWQGPLRSRLGHHLVLVEARTEARAAELREVEAELRLDLLIERRERAVATFLDAARRRYRVTLDGAPISVPAGRARSAARFAASVED